MFPTTRWTLILASQKDGAAERVALDQLFTTYWKPIYFFLRRKGLAPEAAEDAVQGFFLHLLELLAATILVLSLSALAVLTLAGIAPRLPAAPRVLLTLSSLSLLGGMACALAYAVGEFTGIGLISLGQVARIHGPLNALGFVLAGLLGWTLVPRNLRPETL